MTPDHRCDKELGIGPCKICEQQERMIGKKSSTLKTDCNCMAQGYPSPECKLHGMDAEMKDITGAEHVEIKVSENGTVVWINVNEVCVLRICRNKKITIQGVNAKTQART
jgi:hypothetical protein